MAAVETYDDIGSRTGTVADFWDTSGRNGGTIVNVTTESVSGYVANDRSEGPKAFGTEEDFFIPSARHSLASPARPLNSRPPTGAVIIVR